MKVKRTLHMTVVRPTMKCRVEAWSVNQTREKNEDVAEIMMLRWNEVCGIIRMDRIGNEGNGAETKVGEISQDRKCRTEG